MGKYFDMLMEDVRMQEGLTACMNCGICTGVCPAAEFYCYDPRQIVNTVQTRDDDAIEKLLRSDTIWYCGECMSCRPRCPRGNTPAYVIQSLRSLSQRLGFFTDSEKGRQQFALKRTIGQNILSSGYCVRPEFVDPDLHPEQGPVWKWVYDHAKDVFERFGDNYGQNRPRGLPQDRRAKHGGAAQHIPRNRRLGFLREYRAALRRESARDGLRGSRRRLFPIRIHRQQRRTRRKIESLRERTKPPPRTVRQRSGMKTKTKTDSMKKAWKEYQKDIADDNYFYARSCIRQNFFPGSEAAFLNILRNDLGRDVYEDPKHTSCTGIGYHSDIVPLETIMTVVARQFSLMTEAGYENFTSSCITSFGIYCEALELWHDFPEQEEKAREYLYKATGREFRKPKNLAHTSDVIFHHREQIASQAKYRLIDAETGRPLRGVEHIGCHYAKIFPKAGVGGSEFPYVLAGMIESWGGEVVDYPERRHCCGFGFRNYLVMANRGYSVANSKKKFESMAPYKPDFIVANCPGCAMFLDRWQYTISEMEGTFYGQQGRGIPVLTYEELAGLVLGYDPWQLGMQMHQVAVEPLLDKMGIEYDPAAKYLGKNGKYIGKPADSAIGCYSKPIL